MVTHILEQDSPIDPSDDTSTTPLILAASAGRAEVVKLLITRKAEVNHQTSQGHSALQYACSKGWVEVHIKFISKFIFICEITYYRLLKHC